MTHTIPGSGQYLFLLAGIPVPSYHRIKRVRVPDGRSLRRSR
jgi:hypothetical protein